MRADDERTPLKDSLDHACATVFGLARLVAETVDADSPEIDLLVFRLRVLSDDLMDARTRLRSRAGENRIIAPDWS